MRLTKAHLEFWRERKETPSWASQIQTVAFRPRQVTVDQVINAHAGIKTTDAENSTASLISILRRVRLREGSEGTLRWLEDIAVNPGTVIHPEKRAAFASKWAKRIRREMVLSRNRR